MNFEELMSPVTFLKSFVDKTPSGLTEFDEWMREHGLSISEAVDRAGTPNLRMFDRFGKRVDEIQFPPEYWTMLQKGYEAGLVWRAFEEKSLLPSFMYGYVTSFYDCGLLCPYTVSLSTALAIFKYGDENVKSKFLPKLIARENAWQGATWMTEVGGGSDLGASVETVAKRVDGKWLLTGDKYFASNCGAELALVAARPEGAAAGVRGLALFLVPRFTDDGRLNYLIRRIKNKIGTRAVPTGEVELRASEAYLLGKPEHGIYLILEVLNTSRVMNSIASAAITQRSIAESLEFARRRIAFGKPILEHPLLKRQFDENAARLRECFALAWEAASLLDKVYHERPPYSERYQLFRIVAHLAKYWTAEVAVQTAKWAMEVHGGAGVVEDFTVERLLREAMILPIWEGTPHRQVLDALEAIERKNAHEMLIDHISRRRSPTDAALLKHKFADWLNLSTDEKESQAATRFSEIAAMVAKSLA